MPKKIAGRITVKSGCPIPFLVENLFRICVETFAEGLKSPAVNRSGVSLVVPKETGDEIRKYLSFFGVTDMSRQEFLLGVQMLSVVQAIVVVMESLERALKRGDSV